MAAKGIAAHLFGPGRPLADPPSVLAGTTHLLVSVPPDAAGDPVLNQHKAALAGLPGLAWVGYLSTTGVYGDRAGGWVDESSALEPTGERGRRRVAAERAWLASGLPVQVFRLAGIYGPGQSQIDTVRAGTARRIVKKAQVFGRIHVDDIAGVLLASMARPNPGAIYNVADDLPADPAEVVAYAAALLGVSPPPLESFESAAPTMSAMARSFYDDNKRTSNRRIKEELGVQLRYPDYRSGLRAVLAEEG